MITVGRGWGDGAYKRNYHPTGNPTGHNTGVKDFSFPHKPKTKLAGKQKADTKAKLLSSTVESRFLEPPREMKIGARNQEFEI